jgi:homoserine/homoserine lactone efflux protein
VTLETWIAFCLTETVLCFTPGPAVLLVVSCAVANGARAGLRATLGVLAANTSYFALSALGVGALLLTSRELFVAVKWAGAAYLVWLGLRMLLGSPEAPSSDRAPAPRAFARGFVVQGANPKSIVFFTALLPQFLHTEAAIAPQVLLLGASSVSIELAALGIYAVVAARTRRWAGGRLHGPLQRVGGLFLVSAGARLAAVRD